MNKAVGLFSLCIALALSACLGSTGQENETDPENLFFDFKIWGEEGNDSITVMLFFRDGGPTGPAVGIEEPGTVFLDGERLLPDSNAMTGVFYTVSKQVKSFTGQHSIHYTASNKKKYREDFVFRPFAIKATLPDTLKRERLVIQLEGLGQPDVLRMLVSDTSFPGDGIQRMDTVWNNRLVITKGELDNLYSGPVYLELNKENERPVDKGTREGGMVSVSYSVRRELFLLD
jgi:hypothetical protein